MAKEKKRKKKGHDPDDYYTMSKKEADKKRGKKPSGKSVGHISQYEGDAVGYFVNWDTRSRPVKKKKKAKSKSKR